MSFADIIELMYGLTGRTDIADEVFAIIRQNFDRELMDSEKEWLEEFKKMSVKEQKQKAVKFIEGLIKLGGDLTAQEKLNNWKNRIN